MHTVSCSGTYFLKLNSIQSKAVLAWPQSDEHAALMIDCTLKRVSSSAVKHIQRQAVLQIILNESEIADVQAEYEGPGKTLKRINSLLPICYTAKMLCVIPC